MSPYSSLVVVWYSVGGRALFHHPHYCSSGTLTLHHVNSMQVGWEGCVVTGTEACYIKSVILCALLLAPTVRLSFVISSKGLLRKRVDPRGFSCEYEEER